MEQSELESHPQSDLDSDSEDPIDKHKRELAQLAITDPQFYEFLKKEQGGEELLRFGQDDNNDIVLSFLYFHNVCLCLFH